MHENDPSVVNAGTRPEDGFERRDVAVGPLVKWTVGFFVLTIVMIAITLGLFYIFKGIFGEDFLAGRQAPTMIDPAKTYKVQGGLQARVDIKEYRRAEAEATTTYGYVDSARGIARIPVDRAMDMVAQKGFPQWGDTSGIPAAMSNPLSEGGETR